MSLNGLHQMYCKNKILPSYIRFQLHDIRTQLANIRSKGEMIKVDKGNFLQGKLVNMV